MKGKWAARKERLVLEPWQCFCICNMFGWVETADPARYRFREAYVKIPRKNGKSFFSAGVALGKFAADNEFAAEVFFGANSEEQAKRLGFKFARAMAMNSPEFCRAFGVKVNTHNLVREADGSIMKAVIAALGDGDSPSCAVLDEFHESRTAGLLNTFKTGMGARENPLLLIITTAGANRGGPCYQYERDCEKLLAGVITNERLFVLIYGIDQGDDWKSELALVKANPNLGVSIERQFLLDEQAAAIQSARKQNAFRTKHLNEWVGAATSWLNMAAWDALADPSLRLEDFEGDGCEIGLDLASKLDLAGKVKVFQRFETGADGREHAHYYVFPTCYINRARVDEGKNEHLAIWETSGFVTVTEGNVTDYNVIADDLVHDAEQYRVRSVPHDPSHAAALVQFIQARDDWNQDAEFVEIIQSFKNYSPAMRELEGLIAAQRIHHDGNPVLAWCLSNVVALTNNRDGLFPGKDAEENKIDLAVALLMALLRWVLTETEERPSLDFIG